MAVAINATVQDNSWPSRVLVSVTGLTIGDQVALYRYYRSVRYPVRAGTSDAVTDTSFVRVDAELPFGGSIVYTVVVNDSVAYSTAPLTVTLDGGKAAITDAVTGVAAEVSILAWPDKRYERPISTFRVGGRNVVVMGQRPGFTGSIEVLVESDAARENLNSVIEGATSGIVQIRQGGSYGGVDCYVAVVADTESRWSQDGSDERRRWVLDVVEVDPWAADLEAAGVSLQDLADAYDTLTLDDLSDDYSTLLEIAQAVFE